METPPIKSISKERSGQPTLLELNERAWWQLMLPLISRNMSTFIAESLILETCAAAI